MDRIKIAVAGCGRWGRNVIRTLTELARRYPLDIIGVVTTGRAENAEYVRSQAGLTCETSLDRLLDRKPSALFVVTPDDTHGILARRALERGISVFVEKPLASTLREAAELV